MKQTTAESDKFMLRLPDGMRDQLKAVAAENGRSMNAEIVSRLERSFRAPEDQLRANNPAFQGFMLMAMESIADTYANMEDDASLRDLAKKQSEAFRRLIVENNDAQIDQAEAERNQSRQSKRDAD